MKRLFFLLLCSAAFAQGVRFDLPPILNPLGQPIANAQITLCAGTASLSGSNCSGTAQSFTDITLGTACTPGLPVTLSTSNVCRATGDALGNAGFWLSPGAYIYCVNAPSITGQCYNLTVPIGATPVGNGNVGTLTAASMNSVSWVVNGATLGSCYAALPSTGGTCVVPPNYSETLSANLVLNKQNSGFWFMGPATITMGSFQVLDNNTTPASGIFIIGPGYSPFAAASLVHWLYSGSGTAMIFGNSASQLFGLELDYITIDISQGAGGAAIGLDIINDGGTTISKGLSVQGLVIPNTQILVKHDGAGNFSGGKWDNFYLRGGNTCMQFTGTGTGGGNFGDYFGQCLPVNPGTGYIALDFNGSGGNGNRIFVNAGGAPTIVHMSNTTTNSNNLIYAYNCGETSFATIDGSNSSFNEIAAIGGCSIVGKVTDNGTNNSIYNLNQGLRHDANGNLVSTGFFRGANGSCSNPTFQFAGSPATGLYQQGPNVNGFCSNGVNYFLSGLNVNRLNANQTWGFTSDIGSLVANADIALSRCSANKMCLGTNETVGNTGGELDLTTIALSATAFASLGNPGNGTVKFCNDCTIANPCATGGTGALAKRLNSVWVCN